MKILAVSLLLVGVAFAEEFLVRCKRPICETPCTNYQTDRNGCETCNCMKDPCEDKPCAENEICSADLDSCEGKHPCTEMKPICEFHRPLSDRCPLTRCNIACDYGLKKDDRGCELCGCHQPCEGHECGEQEICQVVTVEVPTAKCKARPLCHRVHDIFMKREHSMMAEPRCTHEGDFEPVQCHQTSGECWCVDDRGMELPETRGTTSCAPRRCHHAHVGFDMKHNMDSVEGEIEKLQQEMGKQLSAVMTIEQDFIDQIVVTPQGIDVVHVEFDVIRSSLDNGVTMQEVDVATTVYHLNMRIKNGDVVIVYGDNELSPIPETWKVEHNYNQGLGEPQLPADGPLRDNEDDDSWSGQCMGIFRRHRIGFYAAAFGLLVLFTVMLYVSFVVTRKKRVIRKKKEKQMRTYKENLAFSNQLYDKMVVPTNDEVEEKKPLDEPNSVSVA